MTLYANLAVLKELSSVKVRVRKPKMDKLARELLRQHEGRKKVSNLPGSQWIDLRIVRWSFGSHVPGFVMVGTVFVRFVVLFVVATTSQSVKPSCAMTKLMLAYGFRRSY
ncbi:hypothetical protein [Granulicella sp. L60]|jgi:hypothetical protein|uniref:hypothetical protein n=1 Tax=Granulicella sp. L60 TaxID=1641866 RepID=UPI00131C52C3|nr:hypothetical protein [Granulicella sp. L60]